MNRQVRAGQQSKRVADYFAVLGWNISEKDSLNPEESPDNDLAVPSQNALLTPSKKRTISVDEQFPDIIDRYPLKDYEDFPFPDGTPIFCFPAGIEIELIPKAPSFFSFVSTSEDGARVLGSCLRFFEPLPAGNFYNSCLNKLRTSGISVKDGQTLFIPKCICLISRWPFSLAFKRVLCGLYRIYVANSTKSKLPQANTIPIERYICNFIDDVPAPPWGKLDVIYYIGDDSISFRCPPYNEPNAWSSFPLYPLFECLQPEHILTLFCMVLTERQVVLVSSQYSLLTACCEALTSLMYPITWAHAYIPILPLQLLGVLGAPFPYILGLHSSFLENHECNFSRDSARIFLDENRIEFGEDFPPLPGLPERRAKKLLQGILDVAPVFSNRPEDWKTHRLPFFNDAFSSIASQPPMLAPNKPLIDESKLRECFLKFFVAILKNYRKYLIYENANSQPLNQFRSQEFLLEHPSDWQPFLKEMISTQSFSIFVDERVSDVTGSRDVLFFDESIDAKLNRYTFRLLNIDTPFLLNNAHKHTKTYVAPSPDLSNLPAAVDLPVGSGRLFPRLREYLYSAPRKVKIPFDSMSPDNIGWNVNRLKKMAGNNVPSSSSALGAQDSSLNAIVPLTPSSCMFSVYIALVSHAVIAMGARKSKRPTIAAVSVLASTTRLLDEFGSNPVTGEEWTPERLKRKNSMDLGTVQNLSFESEAPDAHVQRAAAMSLGLKIAFESLNCLTKLDDHPGEIAYRSLLDACGICGDFIRAIDLLVYMNSEGLLPDRLVLNAVARAFSKDPSLAYYREHGGLLPSFNRPLTAADVLTIEDWRPFRLSNPAILSNGKPVPGFVPPTLTTRASAPFSGINVITRNSISNILFGQNEPLRPLRPDLDSKPALPTVASISSIAEAVATGVTSEASPFDVLVFPQLQWSNLSDNSDSPVYAASKKLHRQMRHSEKLLRDTYPDLSVDLEHPLGLGCPNKRCRLGRPLSVAEAYRGFKYGDANSYTTRCCSCQTQFVPRFIVKSAKLGGDLEHELWCELLSPWTLRKEAYTAMFQDGMSEIMTPEYRCSTAQRAALFWNIVVCFRLVGLPYAFLLSEGEAVTAFPAHEAVNKATKKA